MSKSDKRKRSRSRQNRKDDKRREKAVRQVTNVLVRKPFTFAGGESLNLIGTRTFRMGANKSHKVVFLDEFHD